MNTRSMMALVVGLWVASAGAPAAADEEPEFEHKDPEELDEVEGVEWNARAQGSLVNTTGNSRTTTVAGGFELSRREGRNRLRLDGTASYARAAVLAGEDRSGSGEIDDESEIVRQEEVTSQAWAVQSRYDRFITTRSSLYAAGLARADRPAGTAFAGGGQVGYGRALLQRENHELTAEGGYDFSYERFVSQGEGIASHSLRAFLGYRGQVSEDTELEASGEVLSNLNPLSKPTRDVGPLGDSRMRGRLAVTTELFDGISFQGSVDARYQLAPSPLPPLDIPYADGFVPEAEALDTTTELTLIISFL